MARLQFSRQAASDLEEIDLYTVTTWGPEQADRYLDSLESLMLVLAESPMMGRPCGSVRRGYRRMEHDHHVIFYSIGQKSVLIQRILHERRLPRM